MQKATFVKVGATAGLRLLPGDKADKLLEAVTAHLKKTTPFKIDTVSIIDGERLAPATACSLTHLLQSLAG